MQSINIKFNKKEELLYDIYILLDPKHIGHLQDLFVLCVGLTHGLTKQLVLDHCHMDHHSLSFSFRLNVVLLTMIRLEPLSFLINFLLDSGPVLW